MKCRDVLYLYIDNLWDALLTGLVYCMVYVCLSPDQTRKLLNLIYLDSFVASLMTSLFKVNVDLLAKFQCAGHWLVTVVF